MHAPKFGIGALVDYALHPATPPGTHEFVIERQLSADADGHHYRIVDMTDGQRLMAREHHLSRRGARRPTPSNGRRHG